jgi:hypothetical protein
MAEKHIVDEVGGLRLVAELVKRCGLRRGALLLGYAVLWGAADLQSRDEAVAYLQRLGLSRASSYRIVADFAHFLHELEVENGWSLAWPDVMKTIQHEASQK